MTCKGTCIRYKVKKPVKKSAYLIAGVKRCNHCSLFIKWEGLFCPCCGYRIRAKPRASRYRAKVTEELKATITAK
jgi:rRNA maturation endonuclease Nob1